MKKSLFLTATLILTMFLNSPVFAEAEKGNSDFNCKKAPIHKEMPKLYDENGKQLTAPPQKGQKVYDAKGNEIKIPKKMCKKFERPELNLTEAQKAQMDKIREESKAKIKPLRKQIHEYQNQIWEINENDKLTQEQKREKIEPIFKEIQKLQNQKNEIRKADMERFESLLTQEQKKKLEEFKKNHKPNMKHHHGPRPMPIFPEKK